MKHLDWIDRIAASLDVVIVAGPQRAINGAAGATAAAAITSTVAAPAFAADYPASKEGTWSSATSVFTPAKCRPNCG